MIAQIEIDVKKARADIALTKKALVQASIKAFDRMGLFIEAEAVRISASNTGYMRGTIHSERAEYNPLEDTVDVVVVANAAYSLYVEMGFTGHFVPFHIAPSLYYEAIRRWGWRIPNNDQIPDSSASKGKRWLIPRGRKNPVWGVQVSGKAQPFLRPAVELLESSGIELKVLAEEFNKELAKT